MGDCDVAAIFTPRQEEPISHDENINEDVEDIPSKKKHKRKKLKASNGNSGTVDGSDNKQQVDMEGDNLKNFKKSVGKRERKKQDLERLKKTEEICEGDQLTKIVDMGMFTAGNNKSTETIGSKANGNKTKKKSSKQETVDIQDGKDSEDETDVQMREASSESEEEDNNAKVKDKPKEKKKEKKSKDKKRKEVPVEKIDSGEESGDTSDKNSGTKSPIQIEEGELTGFVQPEDSKKEKSGNKLKSNMKKAKSFFKRKFSKSKKDEVEEISIKPEAEEVQHCWEIDVEVEDKVSKDKKKKGKKSKKHSLETVQNESGSRKSSAASNSRDVIPVVADAHFDGTATTDGTDDFDDECIEEVTLS